MIALTTKPQADMLGRQAEVPASAKVALSWEISSLIGYTTWGDTTGDAVGDVGHISGVLSHWGGLLRQGCVTENTAWEQLWKPV